MGTLMQIAQSVSPPLAGALIASVWQGVVLTAVVALALSGLRAVSPATRMWIWTATSLLLLALPLGALMGVHGEPAGHRALHLGAGWSVALLVMWGTVSLARGLLLAGNAVRLWRLAARAVPVPVEGVLVSLLRGPRRAMLCVSAELDRPSVVGFFSPRVLLPAGLLETLSAAELEHVVRHEMEHLRRRDDWLNLCQQIGLVLFPLNPALVWLNRALCRERELACDDGVLAATQAGRAYAACLVKLAEESLARKGLSLALSALGSSLKAGERESELLIRVRRILARRDRVVSAGRVRLVVGALGTATMAGALCLARCPQWVSFDGGSPLLAKAVVPTRMPPAEAMGMLPVSAAEGGIAWRRGVDRPVLHTSLAVMRRVPGPWVKPVIVNAAWKTRNGVESRARPVAARGKRLPRRMLPLNAAPIRLTPRALPVKAAAELSPAVPEMRLAVHSAGAPTARIVVTEFEISQPMYAAVPWAGGWLIIQL